MRFDYKQREAPQSHGAEDRTRTSTKSRACPSTGSPGGSKGATSPVCPDRTRKSEAVSIGGGVGLAVLAVLALKDKDKDVLSQDIESGLGQSDQLTST